MELSVSRVSDNRVQKEKGKNRAEVALTLGLLYTAEHALEIGLVDQVVVPPLEVREQAHQAAVAWNKIPVDARVRNKMWVRNERLDRLVATRQAGELFVGSS